MWLPFWKLSPGGNPTVLLDSRAMRLDAAPRASLAERIMQEPLLGSEQVGYMVPTVVDDGRMEMAGGELCINATRCAALILANEQRKMNVSFATSGIDIPVEAQVDGDLVELRLPMRFPVRSMGHGLWRADLPGITHFVREGSASTDRDAAWLALQQIIASIDEAERPAGAIGLMTVCSEGSRLILSPLVHVPAARTLIMETACGTGSVAAAAVLGGEGATCVMQPSGSLLTVAISSDAVTLTGEVILVAEGRVRVSS